MESINELTSKLDVAMLECEKVKVASDDNQRRCSHLSRENQRLKQQTTDLGQQVSFFMIHSYIQQVCESHLSHLCLPVTIVGHCGSSV